MMDRGLDPGTGSGPAWSMPQPAEEYSVENTIDTFRQFVTDLGGEEAAQPLFQKQDGSFWQLYDEYRKAPALFRERYKR